ncbi:hypothetical protein [Nitrosophilus labii]|uniref:hypothetical protein n=1 Tax=Nitrosophilus labii TaxID=2706014 RepID=UPI00165704A6|nr:hypothetical protein [Nitrosophilus labii]
MKKLKILLALLLFLTALSTIFHNHDITETSNDCAVCLVQHNTLANIEKPILLITLFSKNLQFKTPTFNRLQNIPTQNRSRSPPLSS